MPDVTRFAGYGSPRSLVQDAALTREEKISGLQTWRAVALRNGDIDDMSVDAWRRLIGEIERMLSELDRS